MLGTKISLLGWNKFHGGLDTKANLTGEHAYYTKKGDLQILFHVSTLLKDTPSDIQRVSSCFENSLNL
jgi:hypothetical protein